MLLSLALMGSDAESSAHQVLVVKISVGSVLAEYLFLFFLF